MISYRIDHIHLKALDVEKTVNWYVEKIGARITFEGTYRGRRRPAGIWGLDYEPLGLNGRLDVITGVQ